jgi:ketosteroid isomerase-like protein
MEAVERANASFYRSFASRNMAAMEGLWASDHEITCIHPGWSPLVGRDAVIRSWRTILEGGGAPDTIRCLRPVVQVLGDVAWVLCTEDLGAGSLVATNVFVREDGSWRLVHHQAGPTPHGVDPERKETEGGDALH